MYTTVITYTGTYNVKSIFFLNLNQKQILDEANVGLTQLTMALLRECLTAMDYRSILEKTETLLARGNILNRLGFTSCPSDDNYPVSNGQSKELFYEFPENVMLNATCQNKDSIVIWEEERTEYNTNDMFRLSLLNILTAQSTVLLFDELKKTKQFELCLLN